MTEKIYQLTTQIKQYRIAKSEPSFDSSKVGTTKFGDLTIEVIDAPKFYADLMKSIFDFDQLKQLIARSDFKFVYDAMSGVAGPFAREVFLNQLGAPESSLLNCEPSEDFNGGHPDPNLTYAHDLVKKMGLNEQGNPVGSADNVPDFGAAADGDADRNMVLGKQFFVTPSDSLAIIAANAQAIPYFAKGGVKGIARSMPTSGAADRVAEKLKLQFYEVPTGWKFFGNAMDAGKLSICGEESFGTGSDHIREKDGMWAVLAWMQILAHKNQDSKQLVTVQHIVESHWKEYGRNYYSRFDYEGVDTEQANAVMKHLSEEIIGKAQPDSTKYKSFTVKLADNFTYNDVFDGSVSKNQGIRLIFTDGSRLVWRLSGTGSVGATIRLYIEKYEAPSGNLHQETQSALKELVEIAAEVSRLKELTGREKPTVIT